jgi:hypothetical protein
VSVQTDRLRSVDRPVLAADIGRLRTLIPRLRLTAIDQGLRHTLAAEGLLQGDD